MKTGTEVPLPASLPPDGALFGPTHFDANVPPMLDLYRKADIETQWIDPSDLNVSSVGHLLSLGRGPAAVGRGA